MIFNSQQLMGLSGKRHSPSWNTFYAEKAARLPDLMQLADRQKYQDEQTSIANQGLDIQRQNIALQDKMRKTDASNARTGNIISGIGLGLQGVNTLNQLTDGGVGKAAGAASKAIGLDSAWDSISGAFSTLFIK